VTRETRPKNPSSSRGFAREARGARGSWGLKTENQFIFLSFLASNNYQKKIKKIKKIRIIFFERPHGRALSARTLGCVCADMLASAWTRVFYPQVTS
jgi:hypothetical protein